MIASILAWSENIEIAKVEELTFSKLSTNLTMKCIVINPIFFASLFSYGNPPPIFTLDFLNGEKKRVTGNLLSYIILPNSFCREVVISISSYKDLIEKLILINLVKLENNLLKRTLTLRKSSYL